VKVGYSSQRYLSTIFHLVQQFDLTYSLSSSNLREIAKQIFHEIKEPENIANGNLALFLQAHAMEQHLINSLKFEEAWDVLEAMKKLVDDESKEQRVRSLLETYPQLITAMYELQVRPF
jgi:hypothetical protein